MDVPTNVILIPARGGSKGVARKNLAPICGEPLISYSIRAALASSAKKVWVSTEDPEIKGVSLECGAEVIDRPADLATDTASTESVMLHFADQVQFDKLVLLQCTSPRTSGEDIDRAFGMLDEFDSVLSVTRLHQFVWTDGKPNYDPLKRPRRQEAARTYLETGALFAVRRQILLQTGCRLGGRIGQLEVPRLRSIDIDTEEDLRLLERLMECTTTD